MVIKSFAHWLLWLVAGGLLLVGLLTAAVLGLFGTEVHDALGALFEPIAEVAISNSEKLVMAGKFAGALVTIITGLFGLYKAVVYAEGQLPKRLEEYIEKTRNNEIVGDRDALLNQVKIQGTAFDAGQLTSKRAEVETNLRVLNPTVGSWHKQQATIDYVDGQHKVLQAESAEATGRHQDAHLLRKEAVGHFEKAGEADRADLRAWKYAAEQAEKIQAHDQTISAWEHLAAGHEERGEILQQAHALFLQGRAYHRKSNGTGLQITARTQTRGNSRDCLEAVRELLGEWAGPEPDKSKLLAECCEVLGEVRIELKTFPMAQARLTNAFKLYAGLEDSAGIDRVMGLFEKLQEAWPQAQSPVPASATPQDGSTTDSLAPMYERLGLALVGHPNEPQAKSRAIKALYMALSYYGAESPLPTTSIDRVRASIEKISNAPKPASEPS